MAYTGDYTTATTDNPFIQRVTMAVLSTAVDVTSEVNTTPNHTNRSALATAATKNPTTYGALFAYLCAVDGSTTTASTDAQIKTRVSATWNVIAGGL